MATSREERMQQRMRGAGRHEVGDDSFGFVLPGVEASPDVPTPALEPRSEPNTSAKRRRLSPEVGPVNSQPSSSASRASRSTRASARLSASKADPYALHDNGPNPIHQEPAAPTPAIEEPSSEYVATTPRPATVQRPVSSRSISRFPNGHVVEEVGESPADAPGSGSRRRVKVPESATRSAKLLRAVMMDEDATVTGEPTLSSPLARRSRASGATLGGVSARSARSTRAITRASLETANGAADQSTPTGRPPQKSNGTAPTSSARSARSRDRRSSPSLIVDETDQASSPPQAAGIDRARKFKPAVEPLEDADEDEATDEVEIEEGGEAEAETDEEAAEEIDIHHVAKRIGQKRARASPPREASPDLGSRIVEDSPPAKKSRQKRLQGSPAKQSHPKAPKNKNKPPTRRRGDGEAIPIAVQRYTKRTRPNEGDADILSTEIPFSNRGGVNVIDVLSQMCDEIIHSSLETLREAGADAKDSASKKELRTKLRALEAFQEELRTRLLEHTIALDTMHALKKRVRSVQKEKLALRTEIMRIRAEREQVALKTDAVRIRHETANRESIHQLGLSSTIDDIELAIENGKSALDLNPKERKTAELANLELLISRVASHASTAGGSGGNLKQIRDFNAFLERAAAALEGR
ncbi:hypothetical protein GGS23DRAFT_460165 [Durotheca rogersii]|uniref:uncharacterized protein n=1 Tax=Durotheca rogersii TaxID=419775 RepID=UPI0022209110|nr:uncharacterized protein GGS23DRAFT_460165 [Durotheca rogersii]KAI5864714.1 hypothetical protein GGS23DRAFT_460165 [Durotheca rogersii]